MERTIRLTTGPVTLGGRLLDTPTADALWDVLPVAGEVNTWGHEIYFTIPVQVPLEKSACEIVEEGDLGYWPTGAALCIFFGPTPISREGEIRPASAVNVFGKVTGDTAVLKNIRQGSTMVIDKATP